MSGIVGIWNLDGRPVVPSLLASLSASLSHRGPDGNDQWIRGSMGLACRLLRVTPESLVETQPAMGPEGTVLVFDGRLDNRVELLASLNGACGVTSESPDPVLVLAAYDRFGERVAEHLAGDFALGLFDPNRCRLLLARDALGIRPLYFTRTHNTVVFASEIKALLLHPDVRATPNDDMLACFLLSSTPADPSATCFKNIASLLPAHCAVVTHERISTGRYWDFSVSEQRFNSFGDYVHAFRHHFTQAVRRRLRSAYPVAVSVSGGLDSSSIMCLAETLRRSGQASLSQLTGLSYLSPAGSPSDEQTFLADIEQKYEVSIERVPIGKLGLLDGCHDAVWHIEAPFLDHQWNATQTFYRRAQARGARVMLTGHWADQMLFPQAYLVDMFRQLRWFDIRRHLGNFRQWMPDVAPSLFHKRFWLDLVKYHVPEAWIAPLRRLRARQPPLWYSDSFRARAMCNLALQPLPKRGLPTIHAASLYQEARSPYHVYCMEWNNKVAAMHGMEMAFPFLDRDLLSFLMSIPGDMQTWSGIPKALLREGMRGILPDAIANRRWKADFTHLVNEGMEQDYPAMLDRIGLGTVSAKRGYVHSGRMREQLHVLRGTIREEATGEVAWALTDLLGLELWLQVFFEQRRIRSESRAEERCLETVNTGGTT